MYSTSKRITAFILLLSQLLTTTSCSGNFNIPTEPEIAHEHKNLDKKPSQADALVPLVNKEIVESNREAPVVPIPITANKNQSLVSSHAKTAPRIIRSTGHSIKPTRNKANRGIDFDRNQVRNKQRQARELVSVASNMTTLASEQSVIEHSLIAKGGHQIQLKKQGNSWIAIVQENTLQGFSRTLYLDVYLAPNFTINGLSKHSLAWQGAHTAVIFPEKSSKGKGYVYIGEGGLLGGGKQQGCHYGPKDRRRDPDNPSRWVCPGPGKHPRTPPPSAPSSSSSSSSSSRPSAPSSSSSSSSRPSTPSSSSFRSSSSTTPSFGPFNPSFGPFRTSSSFSTHQPAKPTYQEQEEEQEAVRRAEDFDRWSRQSDYQWECRKHNHVYESKIETIKDQIFNQSKEIIARSGSYTYTVGLFDKEKFNKSKEIIRTIEDFKTTIRDAICKIEELEQNFRGEDIKRKNKVMRRGGKVVTYCTKDLYKLYELEEQMDDLLDKVRANSGPMRYGMNGETEYNSLYNKKKEVVHITDEDIRAINKELEEPLKRIKRIIREETKSTLIIEECYDFRRKLHDLIQRVKTFDLDQKARGTLKNLEELDQEFEQRIKEEKHKIFVKTVSEEIEQERDQVNQVIESNSDICIILDAASRFKVRVEEVRVALMKGRLKDYKFKPEEILAIFDDSIKKINQAISEQKEKAIKDATTSQEKRQVEKNIKDQIERIEKKIEKQIEITAKKSRIEELERTIKSYQEIKNRNRIRFEEAEKRLEKVKEAYPKSYLSYSMEPLFQAQREFYMESDKLSIELDTINALIERHTKKLEESEQALEEAEEEQKLFKDAGAQRIKGKVANNKRKIEEYQEEKPRIEERFKAATEHLERLEALRRKLPHTEEEEMELHSARRKIFLEESNLAGSEYLIEYYTEKLEVYQQRLREAEKEEQKQKSAEEARRVKETRRQYREAARRAEENKRREEEVRLKSEQEAKKQQDDKRKIKEDATRQKEETKREAEQATRQKEEESKRREVIRKGKEKVLDAEDEAEPTEEESSKAAARARELEKKYPPSSRLQAAMDDIKAHLQTLASGLLTPVKQKAQGQALLKQMAALKAEEEASHKRLQAVYQSDNSSEGDQLMEEELAVKEIQLEKIEELTGQLLAVLDLTIEELKDSGIERDSSKGLVRGMASLPLIDTKKLPTKEQLEDKLAKYLGDCQDEGTFKQLLDTYEIAITKLEASPTNPILEANKEAIEAELQAHQLYKEGYELLMLSTHLRQAAEDEADRCIINSERDSSSLLSNMFSASFETLKANQIRNNIILKLRDLFKCANTPEMGRKAVAAVKGAGKSIEDTAKGILVLASLPVLLIKLGYKSAESIVKWEDKLGITGKYESAKETIKAIFKEAKYDWENIEEYRIRQQLVRNYKKQMIAYNRAVNAQAYHCGQAEEFGYITMEAIQFFFGDALIKAAGGVLKVGKVTEAAATLEKGVKALGEGIKLAEGIVEITNLKPTHYITKSENTMKKFVKGIKTDGGIQESIKYVEHNGVNYIVDGHHRYFAAQKLGINQVPVQQIQFPFAGYKNVEDLFLTGKQPVWWQYFKP